MWEINILIQALEQAGDTRHASGAVGGDNECSNCGGLFDDHIAGVYDYYCTECLLTIDNETLISWILDILRKAVK